MTASRTRGLVAWLLLTGSGSAAAQLLPPIAPMTATTAVAGSQPTPVVRSNTYTLPVFFTGQRRIVGQLNANMPANTTLTVRVAAPTGGTSLGNVALGTAPRDLAVAVTQNFFTNVTHTYTFTPLVTAGVIPPTSRVATYTLLNYP